MPDDGGSSEKGEPNAGTRERRRVPRYSFIASSKEVDLETGTGLAGRVSEISENGCFVDTLNPFPVDTRISLTIEHSEHVFSAAGKVVYVIPNMGMGVAFEKIESQSLELLRGWLRERA